jgi:hypothetical protein
MEEDVDDDDDDDKIHYRIGHEVPGRCRDLALFFL